MKLLILLFFALTLRAQDETRRIVPLTGRRLALVIGNQAYH